MDSVWFEILVIFLSGILFILLILLIILIYKLIKIADSLKRITNHAESVADRADSISNFFEKTAAPVAIVKLLASLSDSFVKRSKKTSKEKDQDE